MAENSFLMISLKDKRSKKLAQTISNDTSRKILDHLANTKSVTESDIAKKLGIPISTIHYNLQALLASKLVKADEFHYSKKGREILHYSLANKFVIIAQDDSESVLEKLKKLLPAAITVLAGAGTMVFMKFIINTANKNVANTITKMGAATFEATDSVAKSTPLAAPQVTSSSPNIIIWFLLGAAFAFASYLFWEWAKKMSK